MQAVTELGIPVSAMAGCSAGAVVGGVVASGTPVSDWAKAVTEASPSQFWRPTSTPRLLYQLLLRKGRGLKGLSSPTPAIAFCAEHIRARTFEQSIYPFYSVAVNLGTGDKILFHEGELASAMMASAAMPLLYEPVEISGEYYTDGAIIDLAPADAICCRHQLDLLIIHHMAQRNFTSDGLRNALVRPWSMVEILHRLIYRTRPWYATGKPRSQHKCPCGCGADILVIEPALPDLVWPLTRGGQIIMHQAREHAIEQLSAVLGSQI